MSGNGADYSTVRSTSSSYNTSSGSTAVLGQRLNAGTYAVYRLFFRFDTSSIGSSSTVMQANLKMAVGFDWSNDDYDVQIVKQNWSAQDPLGDGNREAAYDNCLGGSTDDNIWRNTAGIATETYYSSNNLSTSWINKSGTTYYSLRSNRDFSGTAPTQDERIAIYTAESAPTYQPVLSVVYSAYVPFTYLAYWKFDEGQGTSAFDSSSSLRTASLIGTTKPTWTAENECISGKCLAFNGSTAAVTLGTSLANIKSVAFWVKPNSLTQSLADFDGGTHAITLNNGTVGAVGFTSPTIYVNGIPGSSLPANIWSHVEITTETAFSATSLKLGLVGSAYFSGWLDEVKLFDVTRSATQVKTDYTARGSVKGVSASFGTPLGGALQRGLVGYWKMDEASWNGTPGEVTDSSGNGNHGVRSGDATTTTGKYSNGGTFDGTGDGVTVTYSASPNTYTLATWFYLTQYESGTTYRSIFTSGGDNAGFRIYSDYDNDDRLELITIDQSYAFQNINGPTIALNTWYHAVAVWDGTLLKLYVNGTLIGTTPKTSTYALGDFEFGCGLSCSGRYFDGKLDEAHYYNRALSGDEVLQLYTHAPGPIAHWNMDEGNGTTANDNSGNNYSATLNNSPTWTVGKFGNALVFNGSNQSATATITDPGDSNTIEAWIYPTGSTANKTLVTAAKLTTDASSRPTYGTCVGTALPLNQWTHVVGVSNGAGSCRIYQNGILSATNTTGVTFGTSVNIAASSFSGSIDDVKLYNYPRTQEQILEDMAGRGGINPSAATDSMALVHYKFDEGNGLIANNQGIGGVALGATLTNMASPATATSGWTNNGKFGKGLVFDGSNDWASAGNVGTTVNAVSFWIRPGSTTQSLIDLDGGTHAITLNTGTLSAIGFSSPTIYVDGKVSSSVTDTNWHQVTVTTETGFTPTALSLGKVGSSYYSGILDDLKLYTFTLTPDQIKAETNQGKSIVLGSFSTASDGKTPDSSLTRLYCPPGNVEGNCAPGQNPAPVGEWNFEDNTGNFAKDTTGNNYDGTLGGGTTANMPIWKPGKVGSGLQFDGTDDFIDLSSHLNIGKTHTVEYWMKYQGSGDAVVIGRYNSEYATYIDGPGVSDNIYYRPPGANFVSVPHGGFSANTFYHITIVRNGLTVTFYKNGQQLGTPQTLNTNNDQIIKQFGALIFAPNYWFKGILDTIKIYSYARTPAQVAWDYNQGKPVAWYKLDECSGTSLKDTSGFGKHGALVVGDGGSQSTTGTCTDGDTTHAWNNGASGKFNYSLKLDGNDDYLNLGNLGYTINTASFWIKPNSLTQSLADFDGGTHAFTLNSGTVSALGFASPTIYVDGKASSVIPDTNWHLVTVTTATGFPVTAMTVGKLGANYFNGQVDDIRLYTYPLSEVQIRDAYNGGGMRFGQ